MNAQDEAVDHALARLRAAIEGSRDNGWMTCQIAVCRYLRQQSELLPIDIKLQVLRLAGDIGDGLHREKP